MVPVIHKGCGGQIGWYLRDEPTEIDIALAEDFMRLDGTHPKNHEILRETCQHCGAVIRDFDELYRGFRGRMVDGVFVKE